MNVMMYYFPHISEITGLIQNMGPVCGSVSVLIVLKQG